MNEQVAKIGGQLRGAVSKIATTWKEQEPKRKRQIIAIALAVLALAIGIVIIVSLVNGRYVVLYDTLTQEEGVRAKSLLDTNDIPYRSDGENVILVPSKNIRRAEAVLATEGIPSSVLDYSIMDAAAGLTTTEFEKNAAWVHQQQNRLQDTIKNYDGVNNAIVTLNIKDKNNRAWNTTAEDSSGSVAVHMKSGYVLGSAQVAGIRFLVGSAVGIDPGQVTVTDGKGTLLAAAGEEYNVGAAMADSVLERLDVQGEVEADLQRKAAAVMQLVYPNTAQWTVVASVRMDFDAMVTEIKEYMPLEGTIHGVLDYQEDQAQMGVGQFAEGVVGETDNTDIPLYVDLDGDGALDSVDFHRIRDFAVSYTLQQIEKDGPSIASASLSVVINDAPNADKIQSLRTSISQATNLAIENVGVQSFLVEGLGEEPELQWYQRVFGEAFNPMFLYIIIAALVLLVVALILVLVMRSRAKKRRLAIELAEAQAEQEEANRIAAEIEERKNQLKNAAMGEAREDAITSEVREFAKNNPEITANLLRNWLKEGE